MQDMVLNADLEPLPRQDRRASEQPNRADPLHDKARMERRRRDGRRVALLGYAGPRWHVTEGNHRLAADAVQGDRQGA